MCSHNWSTIIDWLYERQVEPSQPNLLRIPAEADQCSCAKAISIPGRSRSVVGDCRNGDRDGQERSVENEFGGAGHQTTSSVTSDEEVTVPGKRMSMRKTREVLRLYFELKLGQ